ncbi:hypothetical protein DRO64_10340 [Candidatus Bathyarchaeota archaeon]|nr:MAG: hypothetical protein DRO64_10340 [Candidatus Bathyarchaeota archaeon]
MSRELERYIKRLFAPIIVFDGFEGIVTENIIIRVMVERLSDLLSKTATDYEAMVYLHTASLAAPLSEEWQNIYAYLFSKYHPREARKIGVYRDELTEAEKRKLLDLKKWLYKRQMSLKR